MCIELFEMQLYHYMNKYLGMLLIVNVYSLLGWKVSSSEVEPGFWWQHACNINEWISVSQRHTGSSVCEVFGLKATGPRFDSCLGTLFTQVLIGPALSLISFSADLVVFMPNTNHITILH